MADAAAPASQRMTHERFAEELTRFAQACSRSDAGQALASRSALLLHDKAVQGEVERLRFAHLTTAYTFDHFIHAMRAAWIEWKHGDGAEAALAWIENTLDGPDQIPNVAETGTNSQTYFDRALAASREREQKARAAL